MKNKLIIGGQSSGKTTLINKIINGKNVVVLYHADINNPFLFQNVTSSTEYIVLEDVNVIDDAKRLLSMITIVVNRRGENPKEIDIPKIIISSNNLLEDDFEGMRNLEIITL